MIISFFLSGSRCKYGYRLENKTQSNVAILVIWFENEWKWLSRCEFQQIDKGKREQVSNLVHGKWTGDLNCMDRVIAGQVVKYKVYKFGWGMSKGILWTWGWCQWQALGKCECILVAGQRNRIWHFMTFDGQKLMWGNRKTVAYMFKFASARDR